MLIAIPSIPWIVKIIPSSEMANVSANRELQEGEEKFVPFRLNDVSAAIAISFAICAVSTFIGDYMGIGQYNILIITVLTLLVANLFPNAFANLRGDFDLGMLLMYLFFAVRIFGL